MYQGRRIALYGGMQTYSQTVAVSLAAAVAAELKQVRAAQGMTQDELARISGVPKVSIQRYESGASLKIEVLETLATALGVPAWELFANAAARVHRDD